MRHETRQQAFLPTEVLPRFGYQRRARGRMCMFGVLLIIVIVALILVLKFALKMI